VEIAPVMNAQDRQKGLAQLSVQPVARLARGLHILGC